MAKKYWFISSTPKCTNVYVGVAPNTLQSVDWGLDPASLDSMVDLRDRFLTRMDVFNMDTPEPMPVPAERMTATEVRMREQEVYGRRAREATDYNERDQLARFGFISGCHCRSCSDNRARYMSRTNAIPTNPETNDRYPWMAPPDERRDREPSYTEKLDRLHRAAQAIGYEIKVHGSTGDLSLIKTADKKKWKPSKPHPLDNGITYEETNNANSL